MEDATTKALRRQLDEAQEEIERLRQQIPSTREYHIPEEWRLTGSQEIILRSLLESPRCTKEKLYDDLCTMRPGSAPDIKIVDAQICKMRRKLEGHGPKITTMWGRGYCIEDRLAWRERLRAKVEEAA